MHGGVAWPSHVRGAGPMVNFNREYLLNSLSHEPRTFTIRLSLQTMNFFKIVNFPFNNVVKAIRNIDHGHVCVFFIKVSFMSRLFP